MNASNSQTIEQILFERMGMSVEDAVATGTDAVDEKVSEAVRTGIDVDERIHGVTHLLEKLSDPSTVKALSQLLDRLPQIVQIAKIAHEMPNILAIVGDVLDEYQERCAIEGIDVEKALTNGMQAALWLGTNVDNDHLRRIGDLLGSDILNPHAVSVVDNAAKSLTIAQQSVCETTQKKIGMFGLLAALRIPEIQRSLAFAVQFAKCFGKNLDNNKS